MLIDTHAHLDYSDFDPDRAEVISRATEAGVTEIISIGTRMESSTRAVELAENFPNIWATVGIHPCDADETPDDAVERIRAGFDIQVTSGEVAQALGASAETSPPRAVRLA